MNIHTSFSCLIALARTPTIVLNSSGTSELTFLFLLLDFPVGSDGKVSAYNAGVRSLGHEDPLEKEMATHSSTLAWKIPWTEEHGRL